MAIALQGGKVLIHQPFHTNMRGEAQAAGSTSEFKFLNINKEIIAMETGQIDPENPEEILFVGSRTNLIAYDVNNNADLFDHEMADGLNCLSFGQIEGVDDKLIMAGGNCSITGLDSQAEERFWTVTSDNAQTLTFIDWDEDGNDELIVGSDDFAIRVFKGEELVFDINEESKIRSLKLIQDNIFGYCLENGVYGCYYSRKRLWHNKAKQKVTALCGLDYEIESQMHLAVGFENGLIEIRSHLSGKLTHSYQCKSGKPIQKIFFYDYRQTGAMGSSSGKQLIAVDSEGNVLGFLVSASIKAFEMQILSEEKVQADEVLELNQKKIDL